MTGILLSKGTLARYREPIAAAYLDVFEQEPQA